MKTPFKLPARLPTKACLLIIPLALITGCASLPTGPRVAVMPAPGKPLDLFTMEDRQCRNYADQSIGIAPREVANQNMMVSAEIVRVPTYENVYGVAVFRVVARPN